MLNIPINSDIVFLDIEADHKNGKLLQFGAIKIQQGKAFQVNWYSNPERNISHNVIKLIGQEALELINNAPSNKIVLDKIYKFVDDSYFVSFGNFDYNFLLELFEKELGKKPNIRFFDIQDEWKKLTCDNQSISLINLAIFFNVKYDEEKLHNAFYDAEVMFKIYREWVKYSDEEIIEKIINKRSVESTIIDPTIKITMKNLSVQDNISKIDGYAMFNINIKKVVLEEGIKRRKIVLGIRAISFLNGKIVENWDEDFSKYIKAKKYYEHQHFLTVALRKFMWTIKDKKILLYKDQVNDYKYLCELIHEFLGKRPMNSYIIINGIQNYQYLNYNKDVNELMINSDLIDTWNSLNNILDKNMVNKKWSTK
ncbi:MAG: 3'-5' exonuclease [Mycoplasmoidaceae bacterium]